MKKIILKTNFQTNIVEDIGESYATIPQGYIEVEVSEYPSDLMGGYYRYTSGSFTKDEVLFAEFLTKQEGASGAIVDEMKEALNILGVTV